jgi:hypothetical protein
VSLSWSDGTPAPGVGLDARCANDPAPRDERFRARTDAGGQAEFLGLFAGAVRLDLDRGFELETTVEAGAESRVTFTIPAGYDVVGRVVSSSGEPPEPIGGAEIWIQGGYSGFPNGKHLASAASDGSFRLRALAEDAHFGARASGHLPSATFEPPDLPLAPDGAHGPLELGEPGGRVEGRVLDLDGRALAGALVHAGPHGGHNVDFAGGLRGEAPEPAPVESARDGSFALPGDLEPGSQPIHALARGFPIWSGTVQVVRGATAQVEIRLQVPASVAGRVLDRERHPIGGAEVRCGEEWQGGWFHDAFPPSLATTDADGSFVLDWVPAGAQQLTATPPSSTHASARPRRASRAGPASARASSSCSIPLRDRRARRGSRRSAARGLEGVREADPLRPPHPRQDVTDADGRFLLANVGDCRHDVQVCGPDEFPLPPRARVEALPGEELEIVVENTELAAGSVRGEVRNPDGSVPADVRLVLQPSGENSAPFVDFDPSNGAFEHSPVLPGRYSLRVLRGGTTPVQGEEFEVRANEVTTRGPCASKRRGRSSSWCAAGPPARGAAALPAGPSNQGTRSSGPGSASRAGTSRRGVDPELRGLSSACARSRSRSPSGGWARAEVALERASLRLAIVFPRALPTGTRSRSRRATAGPDPVGARAVAGLLPCARTSSCSPGRTREDLTAHGHRTCRHAPHRRRSGPARGGSDLRRARRALRDSRAPSALPRLSCILRRRGGP